MLAHFVLRCPKMELERTKFSKLFPNIFYFLFQHFIFFTINEIINILDTFCFEYRSMIYSGSTEDSGLYLKLAYFYRSWIRGMFDFWKGGPYLNSGSHFICFSSVLGRSDSSLITTMPLKIAFGASLVKKKKMRFCLARF